MTASTSDLVNAIRGRHAQVLERIAASARRAGRSPDSVRLVAVTKSQPLHVVEAAIDAGLHVLGENYAEEAVSKIRALQDRLNLVPLPGDSMQAHSGPGFKVEWHMVGHIQGRKAKLVAAYFDLIHSLDSLRLAERLNGHAAQLGRELPVLLEFNVGGEAEKHGWPAREESAWPQLRDDAEAVADFPNLRIRGLMTMPPLSNDPEESRVYFRRLRKLQDFLGAVVSKGAWSELSMGTSADYAVAVEEGATLVRVGEAILGPRPSRERV